MYSRLRSTFHIALVCFSLGITAKAAGEVADHDDSLDLLKPGPATIHMFTKDDFCNNSTLQKRTSFETDRCHNINPRSIKEFTFTAPPVCQNGKVAVYTAFRESNCWGDVWHSWEVTDLHLDQCLRTSADKDELRSFALVCDGVRRSNSKARLIFALLLLFALSLAVLGLLGVCIHFGLVLVSKTRGSLVWGLRNAITIAKVSLSLCRSLTEIELTTIIGILFIIYQLG
jgi:hypothetical protein